MSSDCVKAAHSVLCFSENHYSNVLLVLVYIRKFICIYSYMYIT